MGLFKRPFDSQILFQHITLLVLEKFGFKSSFSVAALQTLGARCATYEKLLDSKAARSTNFDLKCLRNHFLVKNFEFKSLFKFRDLVIGFCDKLTV